MNSGSSTRADLALAALALIWGATFVLVQNALADASTILFLALRFSLATVALLAVFRARPFAGKDAAAGVRAGALAGVFLFAGYFFQTLGLRFTTASKSAFLTGMSIVLVPLLAALVYRRAPRIADGAGIAAAAAGMALLTLRGDGLRINTGDMLTLVCAFAFACHILLIGHYSRRFGFELISLVQIAVAAAIAASTFFWMERAFVRWTTGLVVALAVTALLATALAFTVQAWAQRHTSATRAALIFTLEPVFAAVTSYMVLGEVLSPRGWAGAGLILAGILLVELKPSAREQHPSKQTPVALHSYNVNSTER